MYQGEHFGEVSIMTNDCRGASIIAATPLHLGYLTDNEFITIFEKTY